MFFATGATSDEDEEQDRSQKREKFLRSFEALPEGDAE